MIIAKVRRLVKGFLDEFLEWVKLPPHPRAVQFYITPAYFRTRFKFMQLFQDYLAHIVHVIDAKDI